MNNTKMLLVAFLLVNALFWGLAEHSQHCSLVNAVGMGIKCPPHYVHLMMGLAFFCATIYVHNKSYLDTL